MSCFGSPPVAGMTKTSLLPFRLLVNAIHLPSGENRGARSLATWPVSRRAFEPSGSTVQMSSWYENATRPSLAMWGTCANLIGTGVSGARRAETVAATAKNATIASRNAVERFIVILRGNQPGRGILPRGCAARNP